MPVKVKCPSCLEEHEVNDVVPQDEHRQRLKAKNDEIKDLRNKLAEAEDGAADADELASLRAKVAEYEAQEERQAAFGEHKISDDPKVRQSFVRLYKSHLADLKDEGAKEDELPSFSDWLGDDDTKGHPLLKAAYGASKGGKGDGMDDASGKRRGAKQVARTEEGAAGDDGGDDVITSAEELEAYFQSPAYKALKPEERRAERAKLQAEWAKVRQGA